ncbi:MAG: SOS response-associated peptidase, partial [Cytophagaceae bacterium]|nr:SOS response-associated peptidase [Cytophagaceae bacterium]
INTFSIITTQANEMMREIHERMPVILNKENESLWLSNSITTAKITELLKPYNSDEMNYYKVNKIVNSTNYDTPECIQVAPKLYPGETFSLFE